MLDSIVVIFLAVFHVTGGAALGQGIKKFNQNSDKSITLIIFGIMAAMGPLVIEYGIFPRSDFQKYGLVGIGVTVVITMLSVFPWKKTGFFSKIKASALYTIFMGVSAMAIGILLVLYSYQYAQAHELKMADYFFGTLLCLIFLLVGFSFFWVSLQALIHGVNFKEEIKERNKKIKQRTRR